MLGSFFCPTAQIVFFKKIVFCLDQRQTFKKIIPLWGNV